MGRLCYAFGQWSWFIGKWKKSFRENRWQLFKQCLWIMEGIISKCSFLMHKIREQCLHGILYFPKLATTVFPILQDFLFFPARFSAVLFCSIPSQGKALHQDPQFLWPLLYHRNDTWGVSGTAVRMRTPVSPVGTFVLRQFQLWISLPDVRTRSISKHAIYSPSWADTDGQDPCQPITHCPNSSPRAFRRLWPLPQWNSEEGLSNQDPSETTWLWEI